MNNSKNKPLCSFRLDTTLTKKLDTAIGRRGYLTRSSFFADVARVTIGKKELGDQTIPDHLRKWIKKGSTPLSEEQIKQYLTDIIKTLLYPVIALKGADLAYETAWRELRTTFREEHGIWLTQGEIREAINEFESLNRVELTDYRNKTLDGEKP